MKKIMIAFAAIAVAVGVQAASVSWTCTNVYAGNATDKASGVAYLMLASDVSSFTSLAGKGATAVNEALADALYSYTPSAAGTYTHSAVSDADLGLDDDTGYGDAYLVIFDTATVTDNSKFYVTSTKDLTTVAGDFSATLSFGSQASKGSKTADGWNAVSVPEPTSGLLLLLGLAGMALKRKIA